MAPVWRRSSTCADGSCVEVAWQSACASSNCVEVACSGGQVLVRDSKLGEASPWLFLSREEFADYIADDLGLASLWLACSANELRFTDAEKAKFVEGVKRGEFDHLTAEPSSEPSSNVDPGTETQTTPQPVSIELSPVSGPVPADDHPAVQVTITAYSVSPIPFGSINHDAWAVTVEQRDTDRWAVCWMGRCMNAAGEWSYEPRPSSREDDWLDEHRFDHDTALALAVRHAPGVTVNGLTAREVAAR